MEFKGVYLRESTTLLCKQCFTFIKSGVTRKNCFSALSELCVLLFGNLFPEIWCHCVTQ